MTPALGRLLGPPLVLLLVCAWLFPSTSNEATRLWDGDILWWLPIQGLTLGLLTALVAVGMALVYRSNQILNFAQGDLGLLPATLAIDLIAFSALNYFLAFGVGLAAAVLVGAIVEMAIIRRFFRAPRLILTVATIGLAQLLAFGSLALPLLWGEEPLQSQIAIPFDWRVEISGFFFDADYLVAWLLAPVAMVAVTLFLRGTAVGIATRAAAERADRASLLGIPVGRLHAITWAVGGVLSFIALFSKAGIVGLPLGSAVGLTTILAALAALLLGRMTDLPAVATSAITLGILEAHVRWREELVLGPWRFDISSDFAWPPVLFVIIMVALALQRRSASRADKDTTSSWDAAEEIRPIPAELRLLPEVIGARVALFALGAAVLIAVPYLPGVGGVSDTLKAATILVYVIIILSVTTLTGWAGQVSLGQMGFVAVGAAVGARAATVWDLDLFIALPLAGLVGALVAVVIGLPALRLRGLTLAVASLAFAMSVTAYVLNPRYVGWISVDRFEPAPFLGVWNWADSSEGTYHLALGVLAVSLAAVSGIRRTRTGRALLAIRENEAAAQAYGISATRAKLSAFALSGFLAAMAGCLLVNQVGGYDAGLFPNQENLVVFAAAVIGGLGSIPGAVLGAIFLKGGQWLFNDEPWDQLGPLLTSSVGVLLVLMAFPGGLGGALFRLRDLVLRRIAERRGIVVPSLLADVKVDDPMPAAPTVPTPLEPTGATS